MAESIQFNISLLYDLLNYSYDSNYSDEDCCDEGTACELEEGFRFEQTFIPLLYSVAFVIGLVGNGVLLGVLVRSRERWSVTDTFILHLSVADLLLLLTLPFWAVQAAQTGGWPFGTPLCKITGAVFVVSRPLLQEHCTKNQSAPSHWFFAPTWL